MEDNIKFNQADQGWRRWNNEEELLSEYPKHVYGTYRPQPWSHPEKYPCLWKEIAVMNNSNGSDHVMLAYIYDFEEVAVPDQSDEDDAVQTPKPFVAGEQWVVCAANRYQAPDGQPVVIPAPRHHDMTMNFLIKSLDAAGAIYTDERGEQGFIDQFGKFLTREEAREIALRNGQRRRRCGGDGKQLFSENLY
jgi:hypothetical protein